MAVRTSERTWNPRALVYDLRTAAEPQVSPDGTLVAYGLAKSEEPAETARVQLWLCGIDGSNPHSLTGAGQRDTQPRWSPDGERLAFTSDRAPRHGLFILGRGGGDPAEVVRHQAQIEAPAWSPDGSAIAYTIAIDPELSDGQEPVGAARVRATRRLDYKQDVRGYLGERRTQLHVVDVTTGRTRMLTSKPLDHNFPAWSPDGRLVAVQVVEAVGMRSHLELVDTADGSSREVKVAAAGIAALYAWSPAGDRILVVGEAGRTGQTDLYLYDVGSGELRQLTGDLQVLPDAGYPSSVPPSRPVWLDDRTVLLHAYRAGASGLYCFDTVSCELEALTDWRAHNTGMSISPDGRWVVQSHSSLESHGELSVFDREAGTTALVTDHNREALTERPLAAWERFTVERGGLEVEAWLLFPPDFDPARRYPLVLDIHGGPQGHHGYIFTAVQQCLAGNGFLVVAANPRGSSSYGRDFTTRVLRDWGGEDYLDLMAVVDRVLERPYADAGRVGVYGYSYGGYMTSWIIGHTDRFRAAVCGAPCFNLTSMYGTSDITPFWGPIQWGAAPHEDPNWYREHSPSTFAHRASTPTLIVHGEADDRCPIGQGEEMFTALSQAGCEVEFVRYPDAPHLFLRLGPAAHREDYLNRVLAWFQDHL
jgi:dipeptidyl aminopeptidase/acylaminoacyl peptidase